MVKLKQHTVIATHNRVVVVNMFYFTGIIVTRLLVPHLPPCLPPVSLPFPPPRGYDS